MGSSIPGPSLLTISSPPLTSLSWCCWSGLRIPCTRIRSIRCRHLDHGFVILAANTSESNRSPAASSVAIWGPLAACLLFTACAAPVKAGLLSGVRGLEAFELPSLPNSDTVKKHQEENRKKYEGYDTNFKSSPLVQKLLKQSKENAEKHKQEIQDKYCKRGADWGVGDCSIAAMSEKQREAFMDALKTKEAPQ